MMTAVKAVLLAGGLGTRLRPLTLRTPKPIVPIFDRPLIYHQIDLIRQAPEIDEVILSLNYRPDRIEAVVGDGAGAGLPVRYVVEPAPLGTGGAVNFVAPHLDGTTVVFNGDVLTDVDLAAVIARHRACAARATIVLAPVDDPSAYGLVETDADGCVTRFIEKPGLTAAPPAAAGPAAGSAPPRGRTINAGVYVLEPDTFDRIPAGVPYSIERSYFPSLVARGETFAAYVHDGYWRDLGTPAAYRRSHRDILDGRCRSGRFTGGPARTPVAAAGASVDAGARLRAPCFVDRGATIAAGAEVGPYAVVGRGAVVAADAAVRDSIVWPGTVIGAGAALDGAIVGHRCRIGAHARLGPGAVIGDDSTLSPYTCTAAAD